MTVSECKANIWPRADKVFRTDKVFKVSDDAEACHCRLTIQGIVQGVGFRPFVYRSAMAFGLNGTVLNNAQGVTVHLQGTSSAVDACMAAIIANPPPLARIDSHAVTSLPVDPQLTDFQIIRSEGCASGTAASDVQSGASVALSPDMATCPDCQQDIADPACRFYRYPFTNCTNCGPRYSIIRQLPYDRQSTTMADFAMCPACERAYHDPLDRRYHAQPISCPDCGPQLRFLSPQGTQYASREAALTQAITALSQGKILAVKGLGGFHLMCDATHATAVQSLRARKHRPAKPFAVMVKDEAMAQTLVEGTPAAWDALTSRQRPIVLMTKRPDPRNNIAEAVAPDLDGLGVMLPYTPLHTLLLEGLARPLVATSANISGEPILTSAEAVIEHLAHVVDGILDHDRPIAHPCDDSVVQVCNDQPMLMRLGRGYAPLTLPLPEPVTSSDSQTSSWTNSRILLAAGAQQKNSVALAFGQQMVVSPYIGDLHTLASEQHYQQTVTFLQQCYGLTPTLTVCDKHPDYASSRLAPVLAQAACSLQPSVITVQHHYAHILAQMAMHQRTAPVLGFAFDGTGLGDDDIIWGAEVMVADTHGYQRVASLAPFMLIGGDKAVQDPTRLLLALLFERYSVEAIVAMQLEALAEVDPRWIHNLHRLWGAKAACVPCSSMGRLFDAVARLLGLVGNAPYEGEAGMKLADAAQRDCTQRDAAQRHSSQHHISQHQRTQDAASLTLTLSFTLPLIKIDGNAPQWDTQGLFVQIVEAVIASPLTHERIGAIAWGFIAALADAVQQFVVSHFAAEQHFIQGSTQGCVQNS